MTQAIDEQSRDGLLARCEEALRRCEPPRDKMYAMIDGDDLRALIALSRPSLEPTLGSHTEGVSGADPALAVPAKPVSRLGATRCDQGESKCDATCLNCAGSGQMAVMTGTRRDIIAYYIPCPNGPAPDVAKAAWGLIHAVEGNDSIPRACGILRWALVAESFDHDKAIALVTRWMNDGFCTLTVPERAIAVLVARARGEA